MRPSLVAAAVALLVLGRASGARADQVQFPEPAATVAPAETAEAAKQEAARRFEHAIKLYEEGDYALALAEFERVYELMPDYRVLYNIGQVSMQLGRYARAYRTLQEYMKRGGSELPSERATALQGDLALLAARTARVVVHVDQPGAEISLDGVVVGTAPLAEPLVVDVGERSVQVKLAGYSPQSRRFSLAGGDRREGRFSLEQEKVAPQPEATRAPTSVRLPAGPRASSAEARSPWLWVGWGSTGILATGAVVASILGVSAASELETLRGKAGTQREELDATRNRAHSSLLVADVLGAAALVAGGATLYVQLSSPSRKEQAATSMGLALTGNRISVTLQH